MSATLDKELDTFRRELPGLLSTPANIGKVVLIHGDSVAGIYPDHHAAIEAGYETFGLVPFMAKRIVESEEPLYFSRNLTRCQ